MRGAPTVFLNDVADWKKAAVHDVVKDIRMAEISEGVYLNVDEHNPFAIRTISEPVQFVDKDDYTGSGIFYVKPLACWRVPLVLWVPAIEVDQVAHAVRIRARINHRKKFPPRPMDLRRPTKA